MTVNEKFNKKLADAFIRLHDEAEKQGLSLGKLGEKAKVSYTVLYQSYAKAKKGERIPDSQIFILRSCCRVLGIPIGQVLDDPVPEEVRPLDGLNPAVLLNETRHDPVMAVASAMPYLTKEQRSAVYKAIYARMEYGVPMENIRYEGGHRPRI